jgi:outer membrane biosynthesis protein TonB
LAGLLLGGVLAHFFGGAKESRAEPATTTQAPVLPLVTAVPTLAVPSPTPRGTHVPKASATPSAAPSAKATPSASPSPLPSPTPAPRESAKATVTPLKPTPAPLKPSPSSTHEAASPAPAAPSGGAAATVVRSYLAALGRGDRAGAAAYLASGSPNETFMDPAARVESVSSSSLGGGRYQVSADVQTATGEYYEIFVLQTGPAGLQITSHYPVRAQ